MKIKSIKNIKIKTKLLLLGGVSILGLIFIGAESIITAKQINEASTEMSQSWVPAIIIAENLNTQTSDYRIKEYYHAITKDRETMNHLEKEMDQVRHEIDKSFEEYEDYITSDTDRSLMEQARASWEEYLACSDRLLPLSRDDKKEQVFQMIVGESRRSFENASTMFLKVAEFNRLGSEAASIRGDQLYSKLAQVKIITICLIGAIITLLVIYIIRAIDKPVKAIVEGTRRVANGDLDVHLFYRSEDEIGILTESVNQLIDRLKNIIDDEKYLFREIGSEHFDVQSSCEQAYRGDFAPILYSISSLMSRLEVLKQKQKDSMPETARGREIAHTANRAVEINHNISVNHTIELKRVSEAKQDTKETEKNDSGDVDASNQEGGLS